jgi:hypothetical protein
MPNLSLIIKHHINPVVHTYNASYPGEGDKEDRGSRLALGKNTRPLQKIGKEKRTRGKSLFKW